VPLPTPEPGLVIRYAYLWHADSLQGREEGVKDRPCAIILSTHTEAGETIVSVLPITHSQPRNPDDGVELPAAVKRRLDLDDGRSWVIVSELNRFVWPGPDLRPAPPTSSGRFDIGLLPFGLFRTIRDRFVACARQQRLRAVRRTE